jgi:hypothetical protein
MGNKFAEVETQSIAVWCVSSTGGVQNSKIVFEKLEKRLGSLRGRKFYGVLEGSPGSGIYRACVAKNQEDDCKDLESWIIPGGKYLKAKINNWGECLNLIGETFSEMTQFGDIDIGRPYIEFYRSQKELILFLPIN